MDEKELHCGKENCECPHVNVCVKGFIDIRYKHVTQTRTREGETVTHETWHEGAQFCARCNPVRANIQANSASNEDMTAKLAALSSHKLIQTYDKQEASKTRIL
jgi:hypothetical protein